MTAIVSSRINEAELQAADIRLKEAGITRTQAIQRTIRLIAENGVPEQLLADQPDPKPEAYRQLQSLIAQMETNTQLQQLTDQDIRKELQNRAL